MASQTLTNGVILAGFSLVSAVLLASANLVTDQEIRLRAAEDLQASLGQVLPRSLHDNDLAGDARPFPGPDGVPMTLYRATRDGVVTAVAYEAKGTGYAGEIRLLLGLDRDGRVLGVRVTKHGETPGLGDRIEARKSDWIGRFVGRSLGDPVEARWAVRKDGGDFDQFSGATITPRAVVGAIRQALLFFAAHREDLLQRPAPAEAR